MSKTGSFLNICHSIPEMYGKAANRSSLRRKFVYWELKKHLEKIKIK